MTTAQFAEDPHPPASDSELLNSAAEHLEARAKAVGDVSDDPAIFVAKARIHDAGVWREAAQEVRGLAPSSGTPHSVETRINSAEPTDRAAILREAVERLRQVPFTNVLTELRRMADEAEYVATPCSFGACEPGGEPCTTHERLMAHAEGDHELCEPDCGTSPSRMAGEAQQPVCPTPESHNWGCGCRGDRLPLYSDRGVDTPGCDCGHTGMGMRWHDGVGCAWFKRLTEEGRRLLADDPADEAQQPETPLRAELKPWQLLGDAPDEPLPQTERLVGGRRLTRDETQQPACTASRSGHCLREAESETACDTEAGECVHGATPAAEAQQPETQTDGWHLTPQTLDLFVRALVNEVDYDIHKNYECGEEDGADHYPELVAEAAEMLNAITNQQHAS